jgi:hypothetical protein
MCFCVDSLLRDNFCRGLREFHSALAPWCSILYSSQLHAAYNLFLCLAVITCFMFTHVLVLCSPFTVSAKSGYEYFVLTSELNYWQIVYLVVADIFLAAIFLILQMLMHVVTLRSGALFNNHYVVRLFGELDGGLSSGHMNANFAQSIVHRGIAAYRGNNSNIGLTFLHRVQDALHDEDYVLQLTSTEQQAYCDNSDEAHQSRNYSNNNGKSCLEDEWIFECGLFKVWQLVWKDLLETVPENHESASYMESVNEYCNEILLQECVQKFVKEIFIYIRNDDSESLSVCREFLMTNLKSVTEALLAESCVYEAFESDCDIFVGEHLSMARVNVHEIKNSKQDFYSCQLAIMQSLKFDLPPVTEYLLKSIFIKAVNNTLFWVETKSVREISLLACRRSENLEQLRKVLGSERLTNCNEIIATGPFWNYSELSTFVAADCLPFERAAMLSSDMYSSMISATNGILISARSENKTICSTVNAYIHVETDNFVTVVTKSLIAAFKLRANEQETLTMNKIMHNSELDWISASYFLPVVTGFVRQMMKDELLTCKFLTENIRYAAVTVHFVHIVLSIVDLKVYCDLSSLLLHSRDVDKTRWFMEETALTDCTKRVRFEALLAKFGRDMEQSQDHSWSQDLLASADYGTLQQYIVLNVILCITKIFDQNAHQNGSFDDVQCLMDIVGNELITPIIKFVIQEITAFVRQQLQSVRRNLTLCNVRLMNEFAILLLNDQKRQACTFIIKLVNNQLWNTALEAACWHVARRISSLWQGGGLAEVLLD